MNEPTYQFRLSLARSETTYRIEGDALVWSEGGENGRLPFSEIRQIRIYGSPGIGFGGSTVAPSFQRCVVKPRQGRAHVFSSNHYVSLGKFEDRSATFRPFIEALIRRVAAVNPATQFISGMPGVLWAIWALILLSVVILAPLALLVIIIDLLSGGGFSATHLAVTIFLLGILFTLGSRWRMLVRNRPQQLDPGPMVEHL